MRAPSTFRLALLPLLAVLLLGAAPSFSQQWAAPRLVLQITVDQLRGDMAHRYASEFGDGGFKYLEANGITYTDALHQHANTETIVGHTTLATGADPGTHGMVSNVWLDRQTGLLVYNIQDARYPLLGRGAGVDQDSEIDPTQRAATSDGRSPAAILVTTFSDQLALATGGKSKIFAVSVKDRGAVPMAGHAGKAFWFSKKSGEFVSSTYYYKQYPAWAKDWNARKLAAGYGGKSWELLHNRSAYQFAQESAEYKSEFPGFGRNFPHPFGKSDNKYFTTLLTLSPVGDDLTLSFAEALIDGEKLGQGQNVDFLSVSFSSTDYVGHVFGPSSIESEDNLLRLDRSLAELLRFIDQKVGLANTVIVLSADHGAPEVPAYLNAFGVGARYFNAAALAPKELEAQPGIVALKRRFGIEQTLIQQYFPPYLYLNHEALRGRAINQTDVQREVAAELEKIEGVWAAVPSGALAEGSYPDTPVTQAVLRNYNRERSGDLFVVFDPGWFINEFDGLVVASSHGSPWRYDQFVPLVFVVPRAAARHVFREVSTTDVAPTLSALLGISPPSGSTGKPLVEVLQAPQGNSSP